MSYEPTLIISYDDLAKVVESPENFGLEEYRDYGDSDKGKARAKLLKIYTDMRDGIEERRPVTIKGTKLIILDVDLTYRNTVMRRLFHELNVEFDIDI